MYEPPSALQLPSLEGNAPAADAAVSSESETVLEPPAALEVPSLEPGQPQSVDPEPPTELQPAPGPAAAGAVLEVTLADGATVRVELAEGRHDVGRAPDCAVYIDDRTLSRCHAGLLAAGHGTGAEFDVLERMDEIRHWGPEFGRETADMDRVALSAAHAVVIEGRGAPPVVELRSPVVVTSGGPPVAVASVGTGPATPPTPSTTVGTGQTNTSPGSGVGSTGARAAPAAAGRSTAVSPRARTRSARTRVALSPSPLVEDPRLDPPDVDPGASPEETLLQLKTRLEALYRALGRAASR